LFDSLKNVGDLGVGIFVFGIINLTAFTKYRIGLVKEKDTVAFSAILKISSNRFSVSPIYLSTTWERLI